MSSSDESRSYEPRSSSSRRSSLRSTNGSLSSSPPSGTVPDSGIVMSGKSVRFLTPSSSSTSTSSNGVTSTSDNGSNSKNRRKNPNPQRRPSANEPVDLLIPNLLIPRLPFQRVVRDIVCKLNPELLIQKEAFNVLQESTEMYLVQLFEDAELLAVHRGCVTVDAKDMKLVQRMQSNVRYQPDANGKKTTEQNDANEKADENGNDDNSST